MRVVTLGLPTALSLFAVLALAMPLVRQRVKTGVWAVVVRASGDSVERFVRGWTVALGGAILMWTVLVSRVGPDALDTWAVPGIVHWCGLVAMGLGLLLMVMAQAQMGASWRIGIDDGPTALVTRGLYRWVRHPIYSGVLASMAGIVLLTPGPWTVAGGALGYVLVGLQSRLEDAHMLAQHGAAYAAWAGAVGRFVPGLGALRVSEAGQS